MGFFYGKVLTCQSKSDLVITIKGTTLTNELLRQFGGDASTATSSAFVQQRKKILPLALEKLFLDFVSQTSQNDTYKGYRLLAVDVHRKNLLWNEINSTVTFQKEAVDG